MYQWDRDVLASANIKLKDTPDETDSSYETWIRAQNHQKINKSLNKGPNSGTLKDIDTSVDADLYLTYKSCVGIFFNQSSKKLKVRYV